MSKGAYIGVDTQIPIKETQTVTKTISLTNDTVSEFFDITYSNDDWPFDESLESGIRVSAPNIGVNDSTESITLTAKKRIQSCFIVGEYVTESNYDKVTLLAGEGSVVLNAVSGTSGYAQRWSGTLNKGDEIYIEYKKDSSQHASGEKVYFDIICSDVTITTTEEVVTGYETKHLARKVKSMYVGVSEEKVDNSTLYPATVGSGISIEIGSGKGSLSKPSFDSSTGTYYFIDGTEEHYTEAYQFAYSYLGPTSRYGYYIPDNNPTTYYEYFWPEGSTGGNGRTAKKYSRVSVARKIKKAYIGVGGVARQFYGGGELQYYGTTKSLYTGRSQLASTSVGAYAIFGPGIQGSSAVGDYDCYNTSLSRTLIGADYYRYAYAATTIGDYALFGGGTNGSSFYNTVEVVSDRLTRSTAASLDVGRYNLAATTVGNYALFGGGYYRGYKQNVDVYDNALTKSTHQLPDAASELTATTVGNLAMFAGGIGASGNATEGVQVFDSSLTRTTASLSSPRYTLSSASVGNYALFFGGRTSLSMASAVVDCIDTSLTLTKLDDIPAYKTVASASTSVGDYALFGGGSGDAAISSPINRTYAYDNKLTRTNQTYLSESKYQLAATSVGNYALFGGGYAYSGPSSVVDVYTIV